MLAGDAALRELRSVATVDLLPSNVSLKEISATAAYLVVRTARRLMSLASMLMDETKVF